MTKIIGLTGGIATGKSTVSDIFKSHDIPVIDADQIVYDLERKGEPGLQAIVDTFGEAYLTEEGELDRHKFGAEVFADEKMRDRLNEVLKPLIRSRIESEVERVKQTNIPLAILDVPLLYEGGYEKLCDMIVVVAVNENTQKERLIERNQLTDSEATQRIASQMSLEEKIKHADHMIDNSTTIENTKQQVEELLEKM
ncbi:dephospho-CoA kinase [Aerococcus vaginalis]